MYIEYTAFVQMHNLLASLFPNGISYRKDKRRILHVRTHLCTLSTRRSCRCTICLLLFSQTGLAIGKISGASFPAVKMMLTAKTQYICLLLYCVPLFDIYLNLVCENILCKAKERKKKRKIYTRRYKYVKKYF